MFCAPSSSDLTCTVHTRLCSCQTRAPVNSPLHRPSYGRDQQQGHQRHKTRRLSPYNSLLCDDSCPATAAQAPSHHRSTCLPNRPHLDWCPPENRRARSLAVVLPPTQHRPSLGESLCLGSHRPPQSTQDYKSNRITSLVLGHSLAMYPATAASAACVHEPTVFAHDLQLSRAHLSKSRTPLPFSREPTKAAFRSESYISRRRDLPLKKQS